MNKVTSTKVSSRSQTGGITAAEVHVGTINMNQAAENRESAGYKWWHILVGLATIIGTAIAGISFFTKTPNNVDKNMGENREVTVASQEQQGGITAQTVQVQTLNMNNAQPVSDFDEWYKEIGPLRPYKDVLLRTIKIRNNTKAIKNNIKIVVKADQPIRVFNFPFIVGGGIFQVGPTNCVGSLCEILMPQLPPQKDLEVYLQAAKEFLIKPEDISIF